MQRPVFAIGIALACVTGFAQTPMPAEFPPNSTSISADQLKARLSGRVYGTRSSDGRDWRIEWKSNGYVFVDLSNGYRDSGTWTTEEGKSCSDLKKTGASCSDMRLVGDVLYMRRASTGEIMELKPK